MSTLDLSASVMTVSCLSLSSCCGSSAGNICELPAAPEHLNDLNLIDRELIVSDKELLYHLSCIPPKSFFYQQRQKVEVLG
jgi:hypothetical protein